MLQKNFFTLVLLLIVNCVLVAQTMPSNNGLIAHYLFNGSLKDESGHRNEGVKYGGTSFSADRFGSPCGAIQFDGSTGFVEVPHSRSLNRPDNELTISTWFKLDQGATDLKWLTVVCKSDLATETLNSPHYRLQATKVTLSLNTDFTENLNRDISLNTWHHYAMVYNGTSVIAFLDGNPYFSFRYSKRLNSNNLPLNIGRDLPGKPEYFAGSLDDLRIYDRALSDDNIKALFQDKAERNSPKPCNQAVTPPPPIPVQPPIVTIKNPATNPKEVDDRVFRIEATVEHVNSKSDVEFKINGQNSRDFSFNPVSNQFSSTKRLEEGNNIFSISGKNRFGRDQQMGILIYQVPSPPLPPAPPAPVLLPPIVTIITPSSNPAEVSKADQTIRANVQNVSSKAEIKVLFNGQSVPNFEYDGNLMMATFEVKLRLGLNNFEVQAENTAGRDVQKAYINLKVPQIAPLISNTPQLPPEVQTAVGQITTTETIELGYSQLRLVLYDHEKEDGDIVSVYLNDQLLVDQKMLKTHILDRIKVDLPPLTKGKEYYIISQAWNIGSIPPNTLTMELYDQDGMVKRVVLESEPGKSEAIKIIYKD